MTIQKFFYRFQKIWEMVYRKYSISLIPIGMVTGIHSENLFYPLQNDI
jgi:hypothetical protein